MNSDFAQSIWAERAIVRCFYLGRIRYALWQDGRLLAYEGSPFSETGPGREELDTAQVRILAPCEPSKIVAVGLNYKKHALEVKMPLPDEPLIFLKPPSSILAPEATIIKPSQSGRVDFEAELAIVIGRTCRNVKEAQAFDYILGYTCLNDVTDRDLQKKDVQFIRAKGFDTFCPLGPAIALDVDPSALNIRAIVNGQTLQDSNTSDMIFSVAEMVSFISKVMTLEPGDVIATGTPEGIAPLPDDSLVSIEIDAIGRLMNPVKRQG